MPWESHGKLEINGKKQPQGCWIKRAEKGTFKLRHSQAQRWGWEEIILERRNSRKTRWTGKGRKLSSATVETLRGTVPGEAGAGATKFPRHTSLPQVSGRRLLQGPGPLGLRAVSLHTGTCAYRLEPEDSPSRSQPAKSRNWWVNITAFLPLWRESEICLHVSPTVPSHARCYLLLGTVCIRFFPFPVQLHHPLQCFLRSLAKWVTRTWECK